MSAQKHIAILATDGFERSELEYPRDYFKKLGYSVSILSPKPHEIQGWDHDVPSVRIPVDRALGQVDVHDFDALILPGGVMNPDALRLSPDALSCMKAFIDAGKPVAAICHGPWPLINVGAVRGKTVTSWSSLAADLRNAGATWIDKEVVVDGMLITSRKPDDLPAFCKALEEVLNRMLV